jgi:DNA-binding IscR family transcriptional regulator
MSGLRNAGYVQSGKGHGGGWSLKKPLFDISLLNVFEALEHTNVFSFGLRNENTNCKVEGAVNLVLSESMARAQALLLDSFENVTLDQIAHLVKHSSSKVESKE